jgi:hypothetical protein
MDAAIAVNHIDVGSLGRGIEDYCRSHFTMVEPSAIFYRSDASSGMDSMFEKASTVAQAVN